MISSVSNVNFRGDAASVNAQDLINSPGKFTTQAPKTDAPDVKPEGEAAPKAEAKPEGEVKAEGEAAPKTEAKPEGEVKPEGENK